MLVEFDRGGRIRGHEQGGQEKRGHHECPLERSSGRPSQGREAPEPEDWVAKSVPGSRPDQRTQTTEIKMTTPSPTSWHSPSPNRALLITWVKPPDTSQRCCTG